MYNGLVERCFANCVTSFQADISKVLYMVTSYGKNTRALTFQNFLLHMDKKLRHSFSLSLSMPKKSGCFFSFFSFFAFFLGLLSPLGGLSLHTHTMFLLYSPTHRDKHTHGVSIDSKRPSRCQKRARVRPRTSKGVTDLLLPQTSIH